MQGSVISLLCMLLLRKGMIFMAVFLGNAVAVLLVALLVAVCARELIRGHKSGGCAGCSGSCAGCSRSCGCSAANMTADNQRNGGGRS